MQNNAVKAIILHTYGVQVGVLGLGFRDLGLRGQSLSTRTFLVPLIGDIWSLIVGT